MDLDQKGIIRDLDNIWINTEEKKNYLAFMLHFYWVKKENTKMLKVQNNGNNIFSEIQNDIHEPRNWSSSKHKKDADDSYLEKYTTHKIAALYRSHDDFENLEKIRLETKPKNDFNYFRGKFTDDDEENSYIDFFKSIILLNYMKTKIKENNKYLKKGNKIRDDFIGRCENIKNDSYIQHLLDMYPDRDVYRFAAIRLSNLSNEEEEKFFKLFKLGLPK